MDDSEEVGQALIASSDINSISNIFKLHDDEYFRILIASS